MMASLVFMNADATPKNVKLELDVSAVPHVMAWYGAYFAGDRYTVALDGRNVAMDLNGEPVLSEGGDPDDGLPTAADVRGIMSTIKDKGTGDV